MRGNNLTLGKKFSRSSGTALAMVVAMLIVTLVSLPNAWADTGFKTLYTFKGGADGDAPESSVIFDQAGTLYGATAGGGTGTGCGSFGCGTVFRLTPNADGNWTKSVLYSFNGPDGSAPYGDLVFDQAGNLYGTTTEGGDLKGCNPPKGCGTIFKLTSNGDGSWTESVLHSFHGADGSQPVGGLIFGINGNLYGTTELGGDLGGCNNNIGCGTVFTLTPNADGSWKERILHSFHGTDGFLPSARLIFDKAGNLYGTTELGGAGNGTVFRLTPREDGSWKERLLHSFHTYDGANPIAGVISDAAGSLYGTTSNGGTYNSGTIFKLKRSLKSGWIVDVIHSFDGVDGLFPDAGLIFDPAGSLYGTTAAGANDDYGTIFKLMPTVQGDWNETVLHSFRNLPGSFPRSDLTPDGNGNLYGTTTGDGVKTFGSVYEATP